MLERVAIVFGTTASSVYVYCTRSLRWAGASQRLCAVAAKARSVIILSATAGTEHDGGSSERETVINRYRVAPG